MFHRESVMEVYKLSDVAPEILSRVSTTDAELDWAFGRKNNWGLVRGKISLWSGERGVGKTRLLSQLMKAWDAAAMSSMIFQGEVSPGQFAAEKMNGYKSDRIFISPSTSIDDQIDAIRTYAPSWVITDSVQQVEEYKGGRGAKEIVRKLREVLEVTGTHVIFISQLTTTGKTKGGTELPHEVDVECYLRKWAPSVSPHLVELKVSKNRYGEAGKEVVFCHKDWGVETQSQNRLKDQDWNSGHRAAVAPRKKWLGLF
jgi:predicted ATP-dependent serine protease